jgi:hypothetical protein
LFFEVAPEVEELLFDCVEDFGVGAEARVRVWLVSIGWSEGIGLERR